MKKIVIFIDHDIIIRHFIDNGVLQGLEEAFELVFVFPENHKRVKRNIDELNLKSVRFIPIDNDRAHLWRRLYQHTVLNRLNRGLNSKMLYDFWLEVLGEKAFKETYKWSRPGFFQIYKWKTLRKIGRNAPLEQLLKELNPDIILHPTVLEGLFVSDLIDWGKRNQIPVVYLMNSWDNPSTKAMTIGVPDWLVVWGEQTRQHSINHLRIPPERVIAAGAAQFDVYKAPPEESKEDFRIRNGFQISDKIILYAGSSKGINEVQHLIRLDQAIESGELSPCKIIFRPHPWRGIIEGEPNFFDVHWNHVTFDPEMVEYYHLSREKNEIIPTKGIEYTHTLLNAIDLVVSPISTIMLESVMHGKPAIGYLPETDISKNFFLRTMANMNFMNEFFDMFDSGPYRKMEELIKKINEILSNDQKDIEDAVAKKADYFVRAEGGRYIDQVRKLLENISSRGLE